MAEQDLQFEISTEGLKQAIGDLVTFKKAIEDLTKKANKEITAQEGSINHLRQTLNKLQDEYLETADAAKRMDLAKQMKGLNSEIKRLDVAHVGGFSDKLGMLGTAAKGFVAVKLAGAIKDVVGSMISGASQMEQYEVSFSKLAGSMEAGKKVLEDVKRLGAATPYEFPELADSTRKLLAFGVANDQIIPTLTRLGDISSGTGNAISEIAELYGKAKVQGRLFAEDINQLTGRGIPIIQELAKQFGVSDSEVKKLVESGKVGFPQLEQAFKDLTSEGSKFGGMMDAQSETFEGTYSTFKDELAELGRTIGKELLPYLKDAVKWLTEVIRAINSADFTKIQEQFGWLATLTTAGMSDYVAGLQQTVNDINRMRNVDAGIMFQKMAIDAGLAKESVMAFGKANEEAIMALTKGDVYERKNAIFAMWQEWVKAKDAANDAGKAMSDATKAPAAGSIDALQAKISEVGKQFQATGSEATRWKLAAELEKLNAQLKEAQTVGMKAWEAINLVSTALSFDSATEAGRENLRLYGEQVAKSVEEIRSMFSDQLPELGLTGGSDVMGLPPIDWEAYTNTQELQNQKVAMLQSLWDMADQMKQIGRDAAVNLFANVMEGFGRAIAEGKSFADTFIAAVSAIVPEALKLAGMAMLTIAADPSTPGPLRIPALIGGAVALGLSGLLAGLANQSETATSAPVTGATGTITAQGLATAQDVQDSVITVNAPEVLQVSIGDDRFDMVVDRAIYRENRRRGR